MQGAAGGVDGGCGGHGGNGGSPGRGEGGGGDGGGGDGGGGDGGGEGWTTQQMHQNVSVHGKSVRPLLLKRKSSPMKLKQSEGCATCV